MIGRKRIAGIASRTASFALNLFGVIPDASAD